MADSLGRFLRGPLSGLPSWLVPALLFTMAGLVGVRGVPGLRSQNAPPASLPQQAARPPAAVPDTAAQTPRTTAPGLARLTYEREFFYYDGAGRRDPFAPLLDVDVSLAGPRFDELVLTGLFAGEDGEGMVVVEDADRKGYFLKLGDVVGRATLVEIHPDLAVFDVRDFGISRRETLKLRRPEETS